MMESESGLAHASAMRQFAHFAEVSGLDLRSLCPPDVFAHVEQANEAE